MSSCFIFITEVVFCMNNNYAIHYLHMRNANRDKKLTNRKEIAHE